MVATVVQPGVGVRLVRAVEAAMTRANAEPVALAEPLIEVVGEPEVTTGTIHVEEGVLRVHAKVMVEIVVEGVAVPRLALRPALLAGPDTRPSAGPAEETSQTSSSPATT